jgi:hypothetical protein
VRRIFLLTVLVASVLAAPSGAPASAVATVEPFALGTATAEAGGDGSCPAGHTCQRVKIVCPEVVDRTAYVASADPGPANPRGMAVFFAGGDATFYWAGNEERTGTLSQIRSEYDVQTVQVRWEGGWMKSGDGIRAGAARAGCRPATISKWIHDNLYEAPAVHPGVGRCGFCLVGSSGSSSAVTYPLTHYAADPWLDGVIVTGGPAHAAIARGCLTRRGDEGYTWDASTAASMDSSYGFVAGVKGPCELRDPTWEDEWIRDALDTNGSDYQYDTTRYHIIIGDADTLQHYHSSDFVARVEAAATPFLGVDIVAGMSHLLTSVGLSHVKSAVGADGDDPIVACANGFDDDQDGAADTADAGCASSADASEHGATACDDGLDNDGDGRRDRWKDPGCGSAADASERGSAACDDGNDNDGDGKTDFPADLTCTSPSGTTEGTTGGGVVVSMSSSAISVTEPDSGTTVKCKFKVKVSASPSSATTVSFATKNGTALAGSDYTAKTATVSWAAGTTTLVKTVAVVVKGDTAKEPNETFSGVLSNPSAGATLGTPSTTVCTIRNDD